MSAVGLLLLMLASHQSQAAVDDGTKQQQYFSRYNNVFFSDPPHMKGRPSTSFVRVKSDDGREYQVHNSGYSYTWSTGSPSPSSSSQCTPMVPKPAAMCVGATDSCSSLGLQDHQCPDFGVCCFNGCVNACMPRDQVTREYEARVARLAVLPAPTCPVVESKTEAQCVNATANCWSRGVPDVDCPGFGLCCYDGCVNTCLETPETETEIPDIEFDQTLSQYDVDDEDDEEFDDNLDEYDEDDELDDDLDDTLDDIDSYGAPKAAPVGLDTYEELDSYGSPAADALVTYSSPAQPVSGYKTLSERFKTSRVNSFTPSTGSINLGRTSNQIHQVTSFQPSTGFYRNPKTLHHQHYPKPLGSPSSVFHLHKPSQSKQYPLRISRKKLFLTEKQKQEKSEQNVLSTLGKFWRKHFGVIF